MTITASRRSLCLTLVILITSCLAISSTSCIADSVWSVTGTNAETTDNVGGTADFNVVGNVLTLVLTDPGPKTPGQGDALSGAVWDIAGSNAKLLMTSISLTGGSELWSSGTTTSNGAVAGSWTNDYTKGGNAALQETYGVATTGFNGAFNGSSITLGNASPDYGIVGAGTFPGSIDGSKYPFIQDSLTFTFTGVSGFTDADIDNVMFLFGSQGDGYLDGTDSVVPENNSLVLLSGGIIPLLGGYLLFRSKVKPAI